MDVPAFHQAKHLARVPAYLQRFAIEFALERIQRAHDIGDRAITVIICVRRFGLLRLFPNPGIGFFHHHLAEIDADEIVLENIMIEHVFGGFAEIYDQFGQWRRFHVVRHLLRIT